MDSASSVTGTAARLRSLRDELKQQELDGFLVPMADAFQSEYVPASAKRIQFLTGFTGSAGFLIVTSGIAAFFTDGRYTLQASQQIDNDLFTLFDSATHAPADWLKDNAWSGMKLGFDPWLHTADQIERFQKAVLKPGAVLKPVERNPVDAIWTDRPLPPIAKIYAYEGFYAGKLSTEKRQDIAGELKKAGLNAAVLTNPSSIAWLLNVRGGDAPHTPLPFSYAIIRADSTVEWFADTRKFSAGLANHLGSGVTRHALEDFTPALYRLAESQSLVRLDTTEAPFWVADALKRAGARIERGPDPCALPRACKNLIELDGMRAAHRRDGAALTKFLAWLDQYPDPTSITELQAEEKLAAFRAAGNLYRGPSFDTIAASGSHGAIVHYRATAMSNRALEKNSLFLIDSGGQYLDGTTDVTRTVVIGTPTGEMRDRFTRVLKGHIALASIRFPDGTTGAELDVLARQHLWNAGLDYNHGTGHGVGTYLGVHEGPQSISRRGTTALKPGMVLSNEPGFYKEGYYGIRLENLQAVVERLEISTPERKILAFETLTLAPFDTRLVDIEMLTPAEREWLNAYHARVFDALRPLLDENTVDWLKRATAAI